MKTLEKQPTISWEEIYQPIQELLKEQQQKAKLHPEEELINCLYHDLWVFTKSSNGEEISILTDVSLSELEGATEEEKIYLKTLLLELVGGYQAKNRLAYPSAAIVPVIKAIYVFAKIENRSSLFIELWKMEDLEAFVNWLLKYKFDYSGGISPRTAENYVRQFKKLHNRNRLSFVPFGKFKLQQLAKPIVEQYASNFGYESKDEFLADWLKGRNFATVPLEMATVLLGYSLEVLKSDEVKIIESYFLVTRGFKGRLSSSATMAKFLNDFFSDLVQGGVKNYEYSEKPGIRWPKERIETRKLWIKAFFADIKGRFNQDEQGYSDERFDTAIKRLVEKGKEHQLNKKGKQILDALHEYTSHVYDCMYVLMLCVTGFRYHEIRNIRAKGCITKDSSGHFKLKTIIDKTESGLIERTVHPVISDVVNLLNNLTYIRKDFNYPFTQDTYFSEKDVTWTFQGIPSLFSRSLSPHTFAKGSNAAAYFNSVQSMSKFTQATATKMINSVWKYGSARLESGLKERLENKLGEQRMTSHGFRHTWVEFALLNFTDSTDGGVLSGIARNFGYSHKDMMNFLENYITGKFSQAHVRRVETEVTKTLVLRLFGEVVQKAIENPSDESVWLPEHFRGDMAVKLALYIREQVDDITMATELELYDIAEELVNSQLVRIEPNPWGYCILFDEGRKVAACIDSKHDIQKENGGAFELCIKCPNHLIYLPVNEDYLRQTLLTHNQVVSFYQQSQECVMDFNSPEQIALIVKASKDAISSIQRHIGVA